jgi:tRNA threonylcarbamoyladenosine biosynthesis protein TsaE
MELADEAATMAAGAMLANVMRVGDIITLSGTLGSGKTTLARGLIEGLGYRGEVPSPSFPIIIPYDAPDVRMQLWHVDLYRIELAEEIEELALDEALYEGALLVEWPERLQGDGWASALVLCIEIAENGARNLTAHVPPAWEDRWPFQ